MIAECITSDSYILEDLDDRDPATRSMMGAIFPAENKYVTALAEPLEGMPPQLNAASTCRMETKSGNVFALRGLAKAIPTANCLQFSVFLRRKFRCN